MRLGHAARPALWALAGVLIVAAACDGREDAATTAAPETTAPAVSDSEPQTGAAQPEPRCGSLPADVSEVAISADWDVGDSVSLEVVRSDEWRIAHPWVPTESGPLSLEDPQPIPVTITVLEDLGDGYVLEWEREGLGDKLGLLSEWVSFGVRNRIHYVKVRIVYETDSLGRFVRVSNEAELRAQIGEILDRIPPVPQTVAIGELDLEGDVRAYHRPYGLVLDVDTPHIAESELRYAGRKRPYAATRTVSLLTTANSDGCLEGEVFTEAESSEVFDYWMQVNEEVHPLFSVAWSFEVDRDRIATEEGFLEGMEISYMGAFSRREELTFVWDPRSTWMVAVTADEIDEAFWHTITGRVSLQAVD